MPALTEIRVRNAKARERPYKLFDELGLFLLVTPSSNQHKGRLWRLRYRYGDVEKLLSLGPYPAVSLKRAREKRDEARRLLADGLDPSVQRKIAQDSKASNGKNFLSQTPDRPNNRQQLSTINHDPGVVQSVRSEEFTTK
jgi:hypothetical protein